MENVSNLSKTNSFRKFLESRKIDDTDKHIYLKKRILNYMLKKAKDKHIQRISKKTLVNIEARIEEFIDEIVENRLDELREEELHKLVESESFFNSERRYDFEPHDSDSIFIIDHVQRFDKDLERYDSRLIQEETGIGIN